jgi:LysM repeat protein
MAGRRSPARFLAPLSLVAVVVAVVVIVQSNRSSSDAGAGTTTSTQSDRPSGGDGASTTEASDRKGGERKRRNRRTYVVKPGDILSTVAEKTGLTVTELQELNPDIDPQALQVGQRLKLRPDAASGDEDGGSATTATTEGDAETP